MIPLMDIPQEILLLFVAIKTQPALCREDHIPVETSRVMSFEGLPAHAVRTEQHF